MNYDREIPDFALQPARESDMDDGFNEHFDPSPYERLMSFYGIDTSKMESEAELEADAAESEAEAADAAETETAETETAEEEVTETAEDSQEEKNETSEREKKEKEKSEKNAEHEEPRRSLPPLQRDRSGSNVLVNAPVDEKTISENKIIVPEPESVITEELKMTDIREKDSAKIYIEEDILVPDTKEDLASILSMTGRAILHQNEIPVGRQTQEEILLAGEIELHTLYIPERYRGEYHIIDIQSKIPFKTAISGKNMTASRLIVTPEIESIFYTVVNERKFRAKITVRLDMREYANVEMKVFCGIKGEKLQLLKEKIQMTHVSERKTDTIELNEVMYLKDSQPKPEKILKYDINIVENHKQISEDKAVISASVYCNVLYLGSTEAEEKDGDDAAYIPQLYQGKVDFTQFIPIRNQADGSGVLFKNNNLTLHIRENMAEEQLDEGERSETGAAFVLQGEVDTSVEIYKNLEREIVTDAYHKSRDIMCDKTELEAMSMGGSGMAEAAVREIINIPEKYGDIKRVIYIYGDIKNCSSTLEQNRNVVEGTVDITLLCLPEDETKAAFKLSKEIGFKGSMEIPQGRKNMKANSEAAIKELWFDKINAKQIEVNANLSICSSVYCQEKYQVIQNVCFVENDREQSVRPGMVVYITKEGDSLWDIAKNYRTTMKMITEINGLEEEQEIKPGMKLLIVK
ncbi:MAG: SPOCS domain-containing protein [Anaerovoracaceae bacterium]